MKIRQSVRVAALCLAALMLSAVFAACDASKIDEGIVTSGDTTDVPQTEAPETGYFADSKIELVTPDKNKVPHMTVDDKGEDFFMMPEHHNSGYRYGCTYLYGEGGSVDAYFASVTGIPGVWDWITYRHSNNGGKTWSNEKVVLAPTDGSLDALSACDPGVVFFDGYYYLAYTSTMSSEGKANCIFVARSKKAAGPFEKWNGEGWGGSEPMPIITYDEDYNGWGIGEPSFVELNGTLYLYYTNTTLHGDYLMVATADARNENWPLTLQNKGAACQKSTDSVDVKYVEEWGKFIGVATGERMSGNSYLALYESNDGLNFTLVDAARKNTYTHLHNAGISSRSNGHIRLSEDADKLRVIYAYGTTWGAWNTRIQPITLALESSNNIAAEKAKACLPDPGKREKPISDAEQWAVYVRADRDVYDVTLGETTEIAPHFYAYNSYFAGYEITRPGSEIIFSTSDKTVATVKDGKIQIVGEGTATITMRHNTAINTLIVNVRAASDQPEDTLIPVKDTYTICFTEASTYKPQLRVRLWKADGEVEEYYIVDSSERITFSGYDKEIISVDAKGIVTAKKTGETTVKVKYGKYTTEIKVVVTKDKTEAFYDPR